jgi:hypothetical protein
MLGTGSVVDMPWSENLTKTDALSSESHPLPLPPDQDSKPDQVGEKQSRLISKVLSPALKLWVRSQLEHVEDLHLDIEAGDRQLLSGAVQRVAASARKGIYQGLHLSQIKLVAEQIQTNLGQVLRGKPFRLLAAFPIAGTVVLSEADLNASVNAPLLANAISDFLLDLLFKSQEQRETSLTPETARFANGQIQLGEGRLTFTAVLIHQSSRNPITIQTGLRIQDGNQLLLEHFHCQVSNANAESAIRPARFPDRWVFDLGSEVCLEELQIHPGEIRCRGQIRVQP